MAWTAAATVGLNLLGGFGQYTRDKHQHRYRLQVARARAKYTKGVAYNHAILAEQEAEDVVRSGAKAQEILGRKGAQALAGIRAGLASSGFTVDGGDAYRIGDESRRVLREDQREMRLQTRRRSSLLRHRASMLRYGADVNQAMAGHDPGGPQLGTYFMSSLLKAGGSLIEQGAFS